jgi:hypothetical protein
MKNINFVILFLLFLSINCTTQKLQEQEFKDSINHNISRDYADTVESETDNNPQPYKKPLILQNDVLEQAMQFSNDSLIGIIYVDNEVYKILNIQTYFEPLVTYDGNCMEALIVSCTHLTFDGTLQLRYAILSLQDEVWWSATYKDFDFDNEKKINTSIQRVNFMEPGGSCNFFAVQNRYRDSENLNKAWSWISLYIITNQGNLDNLNEFKTVLYFPEAYVSEVSDEMNFNRDSLTTEPINDEIFSLREGVEQLKIQKLEVLSTYHNNMPDLKMLSISNNPQDTSIMFYTFDNKRLAYIKQ